MAKTRTPNLPDLSGLLEPPDGFMRDVQRALLRHGPQDAPSLTLPEQIASRLAGLIASDRISPGQRIVEEEVCAVLRVSRAPVREALRILERDRLVAVLPRHGARVTYPSVDELGDIFEVRGSLWAALVEHAMREHPAAMAQAYADGLRALESAAASGSTDAYARASFGLSMAASRLCSNGLLRDMVQSLAIQTLRYSRIGFTQAGAIAQSLREWRSLVRAVRRGDAQAATQLARRRIRGSHRAAQAVIAASLAASPAGTGTGTGAGAVAGAATAREIARRGARTTIDEGRRDDERGHGGEPAGRRAVPTPAAGAGAGRGGGGRAAPRARAADRA